MATSTSIKVVGVGGSGGNAISRMARLRIQGAELIAVNADIQDLINTQADYKIQIGKKLTKGLGAGMYPHIGRLAALESKEEIKEALQGSDLIFIACGLGGGMGTGAAPVVAEIAKKMGALTIAVVTKPFSFEGVPRRNVAEKGLQDFQRRVDSLVIVPNDKLLKMVSDKISVSSAFNLCDDILRQAVRGIVDLISLPGIVNLDFADLKSVMGDSGSALFGVGSGMGEKRVQEAINSALHSPLLENNLVRRGKAALINISGGKDLTLSEIQEAVGMVKTSLAPSSKLIFGATEDKRLKEGEIKIAIFITGLQKA